MEATLECCKKIYDRSPRAFGIAKVRLNSEGKPEDARIIYLNEAMGRTAQCGPAELLGKNIYEVWPNSDYTWLEYFYRAAYLGEATEFETVNVAYRSFQNVAVSPVAEGYCSYEVQDVTTWLKQTHAAMESVSAGMYFYEKRTGLMLLTDPAKECCGLDDGYFDTREFCEMMFPDGAAERVYESIAVSDAEKTLCEEQSRNGKWFRLSTSHAKDVKRFAIGFVEDITLLHEAEEKSARRSEIIETLSSEYYALYVVNLQADVIRPYILRNEVAEHCASTVQEGVSYSSWLDEYCHVHVISEESSDVCALLNRDFLLSNMPEAGGDFSVVCKRKFGDDVQFIELRLIQVSTENDEYVLAARNVNDEMNSQLTQKEALQTALTLAQHASEAKTTFLTNISHDFRTPLNSIMGFSNLALDHLDEPDRVANSLRKILLSSEHLLDLINDILDVSRIESGKIVIDEQPIDLARFMDELKTVFMVQAQSNGVEFSVNMDAVKHPSVLGDQLRMNQIMVNTIGNALKYTDRGGRVDVTVSEGPIAPNGAAMFEFVVKDTGCGMSQNFIDRIFMPFERDSESGAHDAEGTGLGMTITKNLIDLIGGTIVVKSELGKGSSFIITLPLKLEKSNSAAANEATACVEEPASFDGFRVLVVDDDELSREMMQMILADKGFQVEQATDGDEAVAAVKASPEGHFDAVIMDMRMPRMSGDDATRAIRSLDRPDVAGLPIIAATADAFEEGHRRARDAGMTAHITKPLNTKKLLALLSELLVREADV